MPRDDSPSRGCMRGCMKPVCQIIAVLSGICIGAFFTVSFADYEHGALAFFLFVGGLLFGIWLAYWPVARLFSGTPPSSHAWGEAAQGEHGGPRTEQHARAGTARHDAFDDEQEEEDEQTAEEDAFARPSASTNLDWCYTLLGISRTAALDEIRQGYHRKAKLHHPDRGGDEDAMKALNRAYELLKDAHGDTKRPAR